MFYLSQHLKIQPTCWLHGQLCCRLSGRLSARLIGCSLTFILIGQLFLPSPALATTLLAVASPTPSSTTPTPTLSTRLKKTSPTPSPLASVAPSPTASLVPTASDEATTQKLKERIDKILEKDKEEAATKADSTQKKRALVGEVQRITTNTLTLKNARETHSITLSDDMQIVKETGKIKLSDLAVGDWIAVIGYQQDEEFVPKKIVLSPKLTTPPQVELSFVTVEEVQKPSKSVSKKNSPSPAVKVPTLILKPSLHRSSGEDSDAHAVKPDGGISSLEGGKIAIGVQEGVKILDSDGTAVDTTNIKPGAEFLLLKITRENQAAMFSLKALKPVKQSQ